MIITGATSKYIISINFVEINKICLFHRNRLYIIYTNLFYSDAKYGKPKY